MTNSLLAAAHFTLTHRETGRVLLHDLCFSLMPGERLTVIGPSGSGKTLICRVILGQLSSQTFAASGALSFGGYDLLALERHIRCSLSAHGCALFVVTHDLDLLKTLGGTALVLDGGQITCCGAAQEILAWTDGGEGGATRG